MIDRKPDIPDISKIRCADCRYNVDNVNEEIPKMRFCAISGHALDIMDKGLPVWGCPIKDAYKAERTTNEALKQEPKIEWIPVSERLPEESGEYLIAIKDRGYAEISWFYPHNKKWSYRNADIVAWTYIPKPYRQKVRDKE